MRVNESRLSIHEVPSLLLCEELKGFRLISMAVRSRTPSAFLNHLGLESTGTTVGLYDEEIAGTQIGDWYVVLVMNHSPFRARINDTLIDQASTTADTIVCGVHENNLSAFVAEWRAGRQLWSIVHEANLSLRHLAKEGDVPFALVDFINEASEFDETEIEDGVDRIFNVPIDICERLTGFRHDALAMDSQRWDILREKNPTAPRDEAERFMDVEDIPATHWPLALQARAAIDSMSPRSGPGFVVLQGPNSNYMQTAGGDGAYVAEWREHKDGAFQHWVAGRSGFFVPGNINISTYSALVTVRRNEKLSAEEVKQLADGISAPRNETNLLLMARYNRYVSVSRPLG